MPTALYIPIITEIITRYKKLIDEPLLRYLWMEAMCVDLGRLGQGHGDRKGMDTIKFMALDEIPNIPKDRMITHVRIVGGYRS